MEFGTPLRSAQAPTETPFASPSSPAPRRPGDATPNSVASSHLRGLSSHPSSLSQYHRHAQNHARLSPPPLSSQASVDRYVSAPSRQATSMAHFLLTSRERKTPMLIRAAQQQQQYHLAIRSPSRDPSFDMSSSLDDSYNSLVRYAVDRSSSRHAAVASPRSHRSLPRVGSSVMTPSSARLSSVFAKIHLDPSATVRSSRERSGSSPSLTGVDTSDGCGGQLGDDGRSSPPSAMELEPYTTKLARTLFSDVEQTTVLPVNDTAVRPLGVAARSIEGFGHAEEAEEVSSPAKDGTAGLGSRSAFGCSGARRHRTDENNDDDALEEDWMHNEEDEHALPSSVEIHRHTASVATRVPLAMSEVNQFGMAEGARFDASLGVVFECNRTRNFTTPSFRVIPHTPERILDAADMEDDFYMNLIDWSVTSDVLCVALQNCVYLWDAKTCGITELPRVVSTGSGLHGDGRSGDAQLVCGLNWAPDGCHLAVGRHSGAVEVWDVETQQIVHTYRQHADRTVSLSWEPLGGWLLASGSRDSTVVLRDVRERDTSTSASAASLPTFSSLASATAVLRAHETEVCGLKWSPTGAMLASGGNDNQLLLWDRRSISTGSHSSDTSGVYRHGECQPVFFLNKHTAAVKALSWNPAQPALLASGGGSHDKALRFWNSLTGECVHHINTGSQVCGVVWNRAGTELVTAHGYTDNQLSIWRYPSLRRIANLIGHTSRVLHLALSADGQTVVSAAGDETLRFWRCFPASELRESSPHLHRSSYSSMKGFSFSSSTYGGGVGMSPGGTSASTSSTARARAVAIAPGRCGSLSQDRDSHSFMNEEIELR
ncbi:putative cell division cycle protein [Leishmania mexicana MHOM/GT/2001/U1103]|uniref:Cell division cycle protein n=1 Tax=Leishmania mexicana (strain MHOM/GT/2001/U1103) TaxID=929439 RepID=E9AX17_LEIMU|nr:putative cell division cycle protein [Leishmania mexicana MHOM/GT/2001/U1103]CBZ27503.1 putative cell division cycle protein [Leishmania mexicana MHOM/GT/2001/U1103]